MKVPLSWINEYVSIENLNIKDLIEKLTLAGFEVEEILHLTINNKLETILELSATANRPDSLSIQGISKEIAAILNKPFTTNLDSTSLNFLNTLTNHNVTVNDQLEPCSTFLAVEIENFTIVSTPNWLKQKLLWCDIEPQNNIHDLINLILLETGYPFEFYDFDKIQNNVKNFNLKYIETADNIVLNTVENPLKITKDLNILGLYNDNELISLAGIGPLKIYTPNETTTHFLIEGSIFNSKLIRQTSRKIGVRTDRSARYEKGINNSELLPAFAKLLKLITEINSNVKIHIHTKKFTELTGVNTVSLSLKNINEILGPINLNKNVKSYLTEDLVTEYLTRLNFQLKVTTKNNQISWDVSVPLVRIDDITTEIDLIEEIGRLHGFNNFITQLPKIKKFGKPDLSYQFKNKLRTCFLNSGMNELINYSLVLQTSKNSIKLNNPLTNDYSNLRQSLLPKIINNYNYNFKQGQENFEGFEYGHIFKQTVNNKYFEEEVISGIFGNEKQHVNWGTKPNFLTWAQAKGKLELIFKKIGVKTKWKELNNSNYKDLLHPFRSSTIFIEETNEIIGVFGEIHPLCLTKESMDITPYLFEFNFNILRESQNYENLPIYKEYSVYPTIIKDISFIIDKKVNYDEIKSLILNNTKPLLSKVELLDQYEGKNIPSNKISLCFKLTFQSQTKTLKTKEIENLLKILEKKLNKTFETQFRT